MVEIWGIMLMALYNLNLLMAVGISGGDKCADFFPRSVSFYQAGTKIALRSRVCLCVCVCVCVFVCNYHVH